MIGSQPASSAPWADELVFPRNGARARNRVALAAMTNQQCAADGSVSQDELRWLARRAAGGFGIVTTCASHVHPRGKGWPGALGIDHDGLLPGLTRLAEAIRAEGALAMVQLFHGGARSPAALTGCAPLGPGSSLLPGSRPNADRPRAADERELREVIGSFAAAARRAEDAGWDGVELHGAHGYLLAQFLSPLSNTRDDAWGGDPSGRMRLLRETLAAVKAAVSPGFLVGVRISPLTFEGQTPDQTAEAFDTIRHLVGDGIDFLHLSLWDFRVRLDPDDERSPSLLDLGREAAGADCPLLVAGKIHRPDDAREALARGADAVALGRAAIACPDWPRLATEDPGFEPPLPPHPADLLREADVGEAFVDYLRRWPGFVA